MRPIWLRVGATVCLLFTLGAIAGGGALAGTAIGPFIEARSWIRTNATIESTSIERRQMGRTEKRACRVVFVYFTRAGRKFHGTRASLYQGGASSFDAALCRRLDKAQKAGTAHCFYDPVKPENSVLSRRLRHDVLCSALLILLLLGGGALAATVFCVERLQALRRRKRGVVRADEQRWPPFPIAIASYAGVMFLLAGTLGVLCVTEGDWDGFWTLALAIVCFGFLCSCISWLKRCKNGGELRLSEHSDGSAVLRIPWHAGGEAQLKLQWAHCNSVFDGKTKGKVWDLRVMEVKDGDDGWAEIALAMLPRLPKELLDHWLLQLRVKGQVGEREYKARFDFGTVGEFTKDLGLPA